SFAAGLLRIAAASGSESPAEQHSVITTVAAMIHLTCLLRPSFGRLLVLGIEGSLLLGGQQKLLGERRSTRLASRHTSIEDPESALGTAVLAHVVTSSQRLETR